MSLIEKVEVLIDETFDGLAHQIEAELKATAAARIKGEFGTTGAAVGSIHIEKRGKYDYFIGAEADLSNENDGGAHFYWLDQGNGSSIIRPKKAEALGKYPSGIPKIGWRRQVKPYAGRHIVKDVADKHR